MWRDRLGQLTGTTRTVRLGAAIALAVAALVGCSQPNVEEAEPESSGPVAAELRSIDPPAAEGAFSPDVWVDGSGLLMTWLEPLGAERSDGHRVRFSKLTGDTWSSPVTIVESKELFANWADFPSVARAADGTLYAHWLGKTAPETFAYSIFLARSTDDGASWQPIGKLNDDPTHTEHGFVAWVPDGDALRAFWLDGREMAHDDPMTLRTARVGGSDGAPVGTVELLDSRVCECCSTDATPTPDGPLVVYRDRSDEEIRDIYSVRAVDGAWSEPAAVAVDDWLIEGCPVNGPAVAADSGLVTVAWFTASEDRAKVLAAVSTDGGATFGKQVIIDDSQPLGRVHAAMAGEGVGVVTWFARDGQRASVNLRTIDREGDLGEVRRVGETTMSRSSGFPRLARVGASLFATWVEVDEASTSRIRAGWIPLTDIAAAASG